VYLNLLYFNRYHGKMHYQRDIGESGFRVQRDAKESRDVRKRLEMSERD